MLCIEVLSRKLMDGKHVEATWGRSSLNTSSLNPNLNPTKLTKLSYETCNPHPKLEEAQARTAKLASQPPQPSHFLWIIFSV